MAKRRKTLSESNSIAVEPVSEPGTRVAGFLYGPSANAYGSPSYTVGGDSGVPVAQRPGIALPRFDQSVIPMRRIRRPQ